MDDWQIIVIGITLLCVAILGYILKTWRDIARIEGRLDSVQKDLELQKDERESLRVRLRKLEGETGT